MFATDDRQSAMAKLYFYYSAMNAGKTTTLLQSAYNYHERGMRTLILTPAFDDRGGVGIVASRIGLKAEGRRFERDDDLVATTREAIAARGKLGCVLVDEAQFLTKAQVWQLTDVVDVLGAVAVTDTWVGVAVFLGPAAVSIHDQRDVARQRPGRHRAPQHARV